MSAREIEQRLRQRIALHVQHGGGLKPPDLYVARADYDQLVMAGHAGRITQKVYVDGVLVRPVADGRARRET